MKKQTFIINKPDDLTPCLAWLKEYLALGPLEVTASTETRSRSIFQNRTYWMWVTEIANALGLLKDEVHIMLKRRFAVPIFDRDDPNYAAMVRAIKNVRKEGHEDWAEAAASKIADLTSTVDFNVGQMWEYMKDIEHFAAENGITLTFPDDYLFQREDLSKREVS